MEQGIIFDITHFSTHDGPGIRTTVFFKGCPLNCQWCQNPEGHAPAPELVFRPNLCIHCLECIPACPVDAIRVSDDLPEIDLSRCIMCEACVEVCFAEARAIIGRRMTVDQVMVEVEKDIPFYAESGGGVTFSGGEALMQKDFLHSLLKECKKHGIHTALDTSGLVPWNVIDTIRGEVDLFLYDLKILDGQAHKKFTGLSNECILSNLRKLSELGHAIILRVPLIPGVNNDPVSLQKIAEFAASLNGITEVDMLPFHRTGADKYQRLGKTYSFTNVQPPSGEMVELCTHILEKSGLRVQVGG